MSSVGNKVIYIPDNEECKAAREIGYIDGLRQGCVLNRERYEQGLNDAWECAKKMWQLTFDELKSIFGKFESLYDILNEFTPSEAIAKIKEYEESKELHIGDEIEIDFTKCEGNDKTYQKVVIVNIGGNDDDEEDECDCLDDYLDVIGFREKNGVLVGDSFTFDSATIPFKKTGRYFPQIEEMLNTMKENTNDI